MAADWHVEYQDPHTIFSGGGRAVDVVDVHFIVDTKPGQGHRDWVQVEAKDYRAENVAALIQEKVDGIKAVAAL